MITPAKARKILHDKKVNGKPLTESQRKFFGARASGYPVMKYSEGGRIEDIYKTGTAEDLWKAWDPAQRSHFLIDHYDMFSTEIESDVNKYAQKFSHSSYADLPEPIKKQIVIHHAMGFYGEGGRITDRKEISNPKPEMKTYLTPAKKQLLSKITSIREKMQKVKDPQVLQSLEGHIKSLEEILQRKTPTRAKIESWKKEKSKRLKRR